MSLKFKLSFLWSNQNLDKEESQCGVFIMQLLFKEHCPMPSQEVFEEIYNKNIGNVQGEMGETGSAHFLALDYIAKFEKEKEVPIQLAVFLCDDKGASPDEITKSQMWDCPNSVEILAECKYSILAMDLLGSALEYKSRAELLMKYLVSLMEIYPTCEAVYFNTSGKLLTREYILNDNTPLENKFIRLAVNMRFFNIEGTNDCIVDSLGMSTLFLPDLQYHYRGDSIDPNMIVSHGYSMASYIYDKDNPISHGETIAGIDFKTGCFEQNLKWKCSEEMSLIQPLRPVLDVAIKGYAAGDRE